MVSNDSVNRICKMMLVIEEIFFDFIGVKRDLEVLSKQCNKLLDWVKIREEQVDGVIEKLEEFYCKLEEFFILFQKVEEYEEFQGFVGIEIEIINQQFDVFKVFQKEEIEFLQVKQ